MVRSRRPPSQTWRTFLENHVKSTASVDFFTVPTIRFQVLYVFLVLAHDRRRTPRHAISFATKIGPSGRASSTRLKPWASNRYCRRRASPWQRAYVERVIGTIRRECLGHVIVFNQRDLSRHLQAFLNHYHRTRTHLGLEKDTPDPLLSNREKNGFSVRHAGRSGFPVGQRRVADARQQYRDGRDRSSR
jgi:putative transposase